MPVNPWSEWLWDRFLSEHLSFPLSGSFQQQSIPVLHVHIALTGRANGHSLETFQTTMMDPKSENSR